MHWAPIAKDDSPKRLTSVLRTVLDCARIALEAEGFAFHGASSDFAADCRRYDELAAAGWLVLRFTYWQVLSEPKWVAGMIRAALEQRAAGVPTNRK